MAAATLKGKGTGMKVHAHKLSFVSFSKWGRSCLPRHIAFRQSFMGPPCPPAPQNRLCTPVHLHRDSIGCGSSSLFAKPHTLSEQLMLCWRHVYGFLDIQGLHACLSYSLNILAGAALAFQTVVRTLQTLLKSLSFYLGGDCTMGRAIGENTIQNEKSLDYSLSK